MTGVGGTTKMRIQLFQPKTNIMVSDRLVEQSTEFMKGPSEPWEGPIGLEVTLYSQTQVGMLKEYLDKLVGNLPIEEKVKKLKKPKDDMLGDKSPIEDLLKEAKSKAKTQEELIDLLREKWDFRFVDKTFILDYVPEDKLKIPEDTDYQFMVRMHREAKEPANDKYDWRLVFGIKFIGERVSKVKVYLYGKFDKKETWELPWSKPKVHNFKKVTPIYSFPEFMTYEERKKWRSENRKFLKAREAGESAEFKHSKQFERWSPYVKINGVEIDYFKK